MGLLLGGIVFRTRAVGTLSRLRLLLIPVRVIVLETTVAALAVLDLQNSVEVGFLVHPV